MNHFQPYPKDDKPSDINRQVARVVTEKDLPFSTLTNEESNFFDILFCVEQSQLHQVQAAGCDLPFIEQGDMFITSSRPPDAEIYRLYILREGKEYLLYPHETQPTDTIIGHVVSYIKFLRTPRMWKAYLNQSRKSAVVLSEELNNFYFSKFLTEGGNDAYMKVEGVNMVSAGIFPGDIVLINEKLPLRSGDIAALQSGSGCLLKRYTIRQIGKAKEAEVFVSESEDKNCNRISYLRDDPFIISIIGVVTTIIRLGYPVDLPL
jgi:hypothetical protein